MTPDWAPRALALWVAMVPVPTMATELGVPASAIWRQRQVGNWPPRQRQGKSKAEILRIAKELWMKDVPRVDIGLLCGVATGTIDLWRKQEGWPHRSPGLRRRGDAALVDSPKERARHAVIRHRQNVAKQRFAVRWRCCNRLLEVPACPECHRPNPLSA